MSALWLHVTITIIDIIMYARWKIISSSVFKLPTEAYTSTLGLLSHWLTHSLIGPHNAYFIVIFKLFYIPSHFLHIPTPKINNKKIIHFFLLNTILIPLSPGWALTRRPWRLRWHGICNACRDSTLHVYWHYAILEFQGATHSSFYEVPSSYCLLSLLFPMPSLPSRVLLPLPISTFHLPFTSSPIPLFK